MPKDILQVGPLPWGRINLWTRLSARQMASGSVMSFPLRQHHIADGTALTVVHVSKVPTEFRRQGVIDIENRELKILDAERLARIADVRPD